MRATDRVQFLPSGNATMNYYGVGIFPFTTFNCCGKSAPDRFGGTAQGRCEGCWRKCLFFEATVCGWRPDDKT